MPKKDVRGCVMSRKPIRDREWVIGAIFANRAELAKSGIHTPLQAGISGSGATGAASIVLSGGYEDDEDADDTIVYTGQGGRDQNSGRQTTDQVLIRGNLALARSRDTGVPVRVVRGHTLHSDYAPTEGYRYDGLYRVVDYWAEQGKSGFLVYRYRLRKCYSGGEVESDENESGTAGTTPPERRQSTVQRIVRDTALGREIKKLYRDACQFCGTVITLRAGRYSEAAHVRPLGRPHNGPDSKDNILCVCPNCHVRFDDRSIVVREDMSLIGSKGKLRVHHSHKISRKHLEYHRSLAGIVDHD